MGLMTICDEFAFPQQIFSPHLMAIQVLRKHSLGRDMLYQFIHAPHQGTFPDATPTLLLPSTAAPGENITAQTVTPA